MSIVASSFAAFCSEQLSEGSFMGNGLQENRMVLDGGLQPLSSLCLPFAVCSFVVCTLVSVPLVGCSQF